MHSKIFQISRKPIDREDYLSESRYYNGFVGEIADYVNGALSDNDIKANKKWLLDETLAGAIVKHDENSFTISDKTKYFEKKYKDFIDAVTEAQAMTLEDFASAKCDILAYRIKADYEDRFSIYVDDSNEYYGLITLDYFMRAIRPGDRFYLGAVIDYHF